MAIVTALVCGSIDTTSHAAPFDSPVGTWDFVISGAESGVAFITFNGDNTFDGVEIIAPKSKGGTSDDGRTVGDDGRIDPPVSGTNTAGNVLYGTYDISGEWAFDISGKVIGFFPEISSVFTGSETNTVTNSVSFVASVVPGRRMTLKGSSGIGKVQFRGVPFTGVPDISGPWSGQMEKGNQTFTELFDISFAGPFHFDVIGDGPTYSFDGLALVSSQGAIAMHTSYDTGSNSFLARVVAGKFNFKAFKASLRGTEGDGATAQKVSVLIAPTPLP